MLNHRLVESYQLVESYREHLTKISFPEYLRKNGKSLSLMCIKRAWAYHSSQKEKKRMYMI